MGELIANDVIGTVTSGGTTAPSAGTSQTLTINFTNPAPACSTSATPPTWFYIADAASASETEKMMVTSCPGGTGSMSVTVTRGADGTTPVTHTSGYTIQQVATRATFYRGTGLGPSGDTSGATDYANITALLNLGGRAVLQDGQFYLNAALALGNNYTVSGQGRGITVLNQVSTTADVFSWSGTQLQFVTIRDLQITGPGSGSGIGVSLAASGASGNPNVLGLHMENVFIEEMGGDGIYTSILILSQFDNVMCTSNGGIGFHIQTANSDTPTSVVFNSCYANSNTGHGFDLETSTYCVLNGCGTDGNTVGYYLNGCEGISLNGCGAEASQYGFEIYNCNGVTLDSCYTDGNTGISYWVTHSSANVTLIGCQEIAPSGATHSFQFDTGTNVNVIGWNYTTSPLQTAIPNQLNDGGGNFQVAGSSYLNGQVFAYDGISMVSTKITNLTNGSASTDGAAYGQTLAGGSLSPMTTKGDLIIANATPAPARLAVGAANQVVGVASGMPAWQAGWTLEASTVAAGFTMANSTGTIVSWTAPNDGNVHWAMVNGYLYATTTEVGGQINLLFTDPAGHSITATAFIAAAVTSGNASWNYEIIPVEANTTVSLTQATAMTSGAAKCWAQIWGM